MVIVAIQRALSCPIVFKKVGYIRCGSYKKKLCDEPALEKKLWGKLLDPAATFEKLHAAENLDLPSVLMRLDYAAYFERTGIQQPFDTSNIAHYLEEDGIIKPQDNGQYSITNLGALLFAQKLSDYPQLSRKRLRIIQYNGNSKISTKNDTIFDKGYASSFDEMIRYIVGLLPAEEEIVDGIHKINSRYPEIVVRELLANALVHQDFTLTGAGPTLEIFDDRFEVTNPGELFVDEMRIIDNPPRSRNESLAMLMRRCHICEEAGSGWDKVVAAAEKVSLPAPRILEYSGSGYSSTKVVVHSFVPLDKLSTDDKIWSCYLHACLRHTIDEMLTNTSLRERFGVSPNCSSSISRIIKASLDKDLIKPFDPKTARRYMKYIPFWA
ncbi:MAG TPA: transcriptional regulator [Methanocorpusculum sp.]|nr:transcriptional regulator [Methanocorpusculum sp.]